jgi:hypothetical protein
VSQVSLIPSLQSDALLREIEQQLAREVSAIAASAQHDARAIMTQAHAAARSQMHAAIQKLREEGVRRLTRAKAQLETEERARAQQQAARAVREALPMLREAMSERWRGRDSRKQWTEAVARLCEDRLPAGAWRIEHPRDWSETEQKQFAASLGDGVQPIFEAAGDVAAGLRISADQALLDATPQGLLADSVAITAMLLEEIGEPP